MNYIKIVVNTTPEIQEIIIAQMVELGYDGFEESENELKCFMPETGFDEILLAEVLMPYHLKYELEIIPKQNWNALWESNFSPICVDDFVGIRADFHATLIGVTHEIVITPKMSFGTGHHGTTYSVIQLMEYIDFNNKSVFDFGTGTGILAIVAEKLGANSIVAVDNDDWCIENATENIEKNNCRHIEIQKVDNASCDKKFDVVIANINKHIILDNLQFLNEALATNGNVILSGLLVEDEADILQSTQNFGWKHLQTKSKDNWIAIHFHN